MPTTEEPAPPACCLMLAWISSRIVIAAMPPVASNLQITTNDGPAVNARGYDPLMAEQENGSSLLAEALARVGDRWTLLVVEALLGGPQRFSDLLGGSPPAPRVRHPSRGPLVLPDLRPPRRPRAPRRRGQLPVTPGPAGPPCTLSSPESTSRSGAEGWRGTGCGDRAD